VLIEKEGLCGRKTGKEWNFTPQGAIISTLIVPTMIRSVYLYWKEKKQEF